MKRIHSIARIAMCVAAVGMVLPMNAMAADQVTKSMVKVTDVMLDANGTLAGQFVDAQGQPVDGATVGVFLAGKLVARTTTSKTGTYGVAGLKDGVYEVSCAGTTRSFRVWSNQIAPPAAQQTATIVADGNVVRGQGSIDGPLSGTNGLALGLGVAGITLGTIAIVEANDDDDDNVIVSP